MKDDFIKKALVFGIVVLFFGGSVLPAAGAIKSVEKTNVVTNVISNNTIIVDNEGDGDYIKIQDAINDADPGDTIMIFSGTYNERININVSNLILKGCDYELGKGEDTGFPIIDGEYGGDVVYVSAGQVDISGFVIQHSGSYEDDAGIEINSNDNIIIENFIISNFGIGIFINSSSNNLLYHNYFTDNIQNAYDDGSNNIWDNGTSGNYWDDYTGVDNNSNGIGDKPHPIPGGDNEDRYPLMAPFSNLPPIKPDPPLGPSTGKENILLTFCATITDPEGDDIKGQFDWGDGTPYSNWSDLDVSGATVCASHKWSKEGQYVVRVWGKDKYGAIGEWSEPLRLKIPKNRHFTRQLYFGDIFHNLLPFFDTNKFYKSFQTLQFILALSSFNDHRNENVVINSNNMMKTIVVPRDYSTIQGAINHANMGDTIRVWAGTYYENVVVDKMLDIIGNGSSITVIDGGGTGTVVKTTADGVKITNFTIRHSGDSDVGLHLASHYNVIKYSEITENFYGMKLFPSTGNQIVNNDIADNTGDGLWLSHSHENTIENNTIVRNGNNGISANLSSLSNHIEFNYVAENEGIGVVISETSFGSNVKMNNITKNTVGLKTIGGSDNNLFNRNNFIKNDQNAYDTSMNSYDDGSIGNYWDDYTGIDSDSDGIGDTPYIIPGGDNTDNYPPMSPLGTNSPPMKPGAPTGPSSGKTNTPLTFCARITDPDEDDICYMFDWGDGNKSDWKGPCKSGATVCESHEWSEKGQYVVRVRGRDKYDALGPWSEPTPLKIPKNKVINTPFLRFLENHPCMFPLLRQILRLQ